MPPAAATLLENVEHGVGCHALGRRLPLGLLQFDDRLGSQFDQPEQKRAQPRVVCGLVAGLPKLVQEDGHRALRARPHLRAAFFRDAGD
jgi:hypothetical protein